MPTDRVPSVLFAPDSGDEIGGGHVMRCLTLARTLAGRGWRAAFAVGPAGRRLVEAFGWDGLELAPGLEAPADVVAVDNYRLDAAGETPLRAAGRRVVVIDDLADRPHDCDLVVDVGFGRRAQDYEGLAPDTRVLAGPGYALLRPAFAAARAGALARRDGRPVERALVSLGLTDLGGVTGRAVEALLPGLGDIALEVVVGAPAPSLPRLKELAEADRRVRLHVDTPGIETLMSRADVAVGAGGSTTWERACLGLPSLTLILADNQRPMTRAFEEAGLALAVEAQGGEIDPDLLAGWRRLVDDDGLRMEMARRSAAICDGLGAERVADAIERLVQIPSSGSTGS
jgi:UDP-2,4-diacetamido-2,4,6-trideoxy-beta-L-altropyranose hydrolase